MGPRKFVHVFDAYAKLMKWEFKAEGVTFSTRFIGTNLYTDSVWDGTVAPYMLFHSVEPGFDELEKMFALVNGVDNVNVNIARFDNDTEFVALSDFWRHYTLDMDTMETIEQVNPPVPGIDFDLSSIVPAASTAHPIQEAGSKHHITYVVSTLPTGKYVLTVSRIISSEIREKIASIELDRSPYMHSFGLTENYAIIFMAPLFSNPDKILETGIPIESIEWFGNETTKVYIVELKSGEITTLETEARFGMHHANAFEDVTGRIIFDVVTYDNLDILQQMKMKILIDRDLRKNVPNDAELKRYVVDLCDSTISAQTFTRETGKEFVNKLDFPTINENYRFKKYCYVYGLVQKMDNVTLSKGGIVKKDLCGRGRDQVWHVANHYASEPYFIPNPTLTSEDDGIVLNVVLDGVKGKSFLGMFDAKTLKLINRSEDLPFHLPFQLHGKFYPDL